MPPDEPSTRPPSPAVPVIDYHGAPPAAEADADAARRRAALRAGVVERVRACAVVAAVALALYLYTLAVTWMGG